MAQREIRNKGGRVMGVVNMVGSTIARESDGGVYVHAGLEIAVASTKAFTSQVMSFALLALMFARMRDYSLADGKALVKEIMEIPVLMRRVLDSAEEVRRIARKYKDASAFIFLGRGISYPVALEGALKLKEIAYIFSEGMSAGDEGGAVSAAHRDPAPAPGVLHRGGAGQERGQAQEPGKERHGGVGESREKRRRAGCVEHPQQRAPAYSASRSSGFTGSPVLKLMFTAMPVRMERAPAAWSAAWPGELAPEPGDLQVEAQERLGPPAAGAFR